MGAILTRTILEFDCFQIQDSGSGPAFSPAEVVQDKRPFDFVVIRGLSAVSAPELALTYRHLPILKRCLPRQQNKTFAQIYPNFDGPEATTTTRSKQTSPLIRSLASTTQSVAATYPFGLQSERMRMRRISRCQDGRGT